MNNSVKKVYLSALLLSLAFVLLGVGFRTYALLFRYTPGLGHFETGFFADVFLPLLFILAIVVFVTFGIAFRTSLTRREYKGSLPSLFASGFAALVTGIWTITFAIDFFTATQPRSSLQTVLGILLLIGAIATVLYFVLCALGGNRHRATVLSGIGAALFCVFYALFAYFDTAFTLGSPIKIFDQITFIVLVLFFLAECRYRFGMISDAAYLPICMSATVLSAASSLPGLIYTAAEGQPLILNVMHDFLLFAFFLYALTRQLSFILTPVAEEDGETEERFTAFDVQTPLTASEPAQETFDFDAPEQSDAAPTLEAEATDEDEDDSNEHATVEFDTAPKDKEQP